MSRRLATGVATSVAILWTSTVLAVLFHRFSLIALTGFAPLFLTVLGRRMPRERVSLGQIGVSLALMAAALGISLVVLLVLATS